METFNELPLHDMPPAHAVEGSLARVILQGMLTHVVTTNQPFFRFRYYGDLTKAHNFIAAMRVQLSRAREAQRHKGNYPKKFTLNIHSVELICPETGEIHIVLAKSVPKGYKGSGYMNLLNPELTNKLEVETAIATIERFCSWRLSPEHYQQKKEQNNGTTTTRPADSTSNQAGIEQPSCLPATA